MTFHPLRRDLEFQEHFPNYENSVVAGEVSGGGVILGAVLHREHNPGRTNEARDGHTNPPYPLFLFIYVYGVLTVCLRVSTMAIYVDGVEVV